jgi:hypothetical protein
MRIGFSGGKTFPPPRQTATLDRPIPVVETGLAQKSWPLASTASLEFRKKDAARAGATRAFLVKTSNRTMRGRDDLAPQAFVAIRGLKRGKPIHHARQNASQTTCCFPQQVVKAFLKNCNFL